MILTMAWKSLRAHPVRTAVLGVGFGLGVSVMATLLGVGEVVLDQARSPALLGGGDLVVTGLAGRVGSARYVLSRLTADPAVVAAAPRRREELFLVSPRGGTIPVVAHGTIPSRDRALHVPEVAGIRAWEDAPADAAWSNPDPGSILRAMDRFRPVPDIPERADSWAEWLYFKGRSDDVQFYMTFLVGPRSADGRREAGVRLQFEQRGQMTSYSASERIAETDVLRSAPDLTIGGARVRLDGMRYHIELDLPRTDGRSGRASGSIDIEAVNGRSLPPIELRGSGGWVSGYTVPVMSGRLSGALTVEGRHVVLAGSGYHDHNWGFWKGVSWRWGQVEHEGLSYVYGRVIPPPDAADPAQLPGFLVALGPDGPVGYATRVSIDETDDPGTGRPSRIVVTGRSRQLDLRLELEVENTTVTRGGALSAGPDFLQMRAMYHVSGTAGDRSVDFTASGAAETFRE